MKALYLALLCLCSFSMAQTTYDLWDSTDPNNYVLIGTFQPIATAETGQQHYDFYSASGHPDCVSLGPTKANIWVHENTLTGDQSFGFIFGQDNNAPTNDLSLNFRIVDSTGSPYVSQSDDAGEAVETPPGSAAYVGNFFYRNNTDGICVSGIGGNTWTLIVDSVDFGIINNWTLAGGTCDPADDITLTLGSEYRLTPTGNPPSGKPATIEDVDGDTIADEDDNCPNIFNPDQTDTDDDGIGDVCDPLPNTADHDGDGYSPADGDCNDNDGTVYPGAPELPDGKDNDCNNVIDDDSDNDGVTDAVDSCPNSIMTPTIEIDGCPTNIPNTVDSSGCTLMDFIVDNFSDPVDFYIIAVQDLYLDYGLPFDFSVTDFREIAACIGDVDGDGVLDIFDENPTSSNNLTVHIDGCDTGAPNYPYLDVNGLPFSTITIEEAFEGFCGGEPNCVLGGINYFMNFGIFDQQDADGIIACLVFDSDGDGVPDDEDTCPDSDISPTVVINGCDTGVINTTNADGCTLADLISACGDGLLYTWQFNNCVSNLTSDLVNAGEITHAERSAILSCVWNWSLPNPVDDTYTTDWSTELCVDAANGLLANDTDPQGNPLETHLQTGPSSGNLSLNRDGSFCYTPVPGVSGPVSFVYKAWDSTCGCFRTATATIDITVGNQAPIGGNDEYTVVKGTRLTVDAPGVLANDVDPDGDPLTAHQASWPQVGHLGFHQDGSFWYDAPPWFTGVVTFVYRVSDGDLKTETTVTIHVVN